mmetsp:Transcript_8021/g.11461  ORF Transcript_8021/g.11461 Transcript_8021/m.11461 type:complete len:140 (+) Transcript_8021:169-588(+)
MSLAFSRLVRGSVTTYKSTTPFRSSALLRTMGSSTTYQEGKVDPLDELQDKSLNTQTQTTSEYALGKHRSNALELLQKQPVIEVDGDFAVCDGGGGVLGHPLEYIKLGNRMDYGPGGEAEGVRCIYCGLRYRKKLGSGH